MKDGNEVEERVDLKEDSYMEEMDVDVGEQGDEDNLDEGVEDNVEEPRKKECEESENAIGEDEKSLETDTGNDTTEPSEDQDTNTPSISWADPENTPDTSAAAAQGLTLSFMKEILYPILNQLSLVSCPTSYVSEMDAVLKFKVVSDLLFKELFERFELLLLNKDSWGTAEELKMILRCSMAILASPSSDKNQERHSDILSLLKGIISASVSVVKEEKNMSSSGTHTMHHPLLCQVLEVFADELIMHSSLRGNSSLRENPTCLFGQVDIGIVLDAISAHLVFSVAGDPEFVNFPFRLYWQHGKDVRTHELSLTTALGLFVNSVFYSTPKILQTHLISLVAEEVVAQGSSADVKPDVGHINCYLQAFKMSTMMYERHMTSLVTDSQLVRGKYAYHSVVPYILLDTREIINDLQTRLDKSWDFHLYKKLLKSKSDLVVAAVAYMKEFQQLFDISLEDEILIKLIYKMHEASSVDAAYTNLKYMASRRPQDIFLLSAILKLMGCTLLQVSGYLASHKPVADITTCEEYTVILGAIGCFEQLHLNLRSQDVMSNKTKTRSVRYKELKRMLLHFLALLSLSLTSGLEFFVKDCMLVVITLMGLIVHLEGNFNVNEWLKRLDLELSSSGLSPNKRDMAYVARKSSLTIASRFMKIRNLQLSACSQLGFRNTDNEREENVSDLSNHNDAEETELESCNGENFLQCISGEQMPSDYDELADFIECQRGKDYSQWLKDRKRYRSWKSKKVTSIRMKVKKKNTKLLWGK